MDSAAVVIAPIGRETGSPPALHVSRTLMAWLTLTLTLFIGTVPTLGLAIAVMTDCTNSYGCTTESCAPCSAAHHWIYGSWSVHAALILMSVGLVWLAHLRRPITTIAIIATTTIALSIGTFTIAVNAATHSYCQPGSVVSDMTGATADYC